MCAYTSTDHAKDSETEILSTEGKILRFGMGRVGRVILLCLPSRHALVLLASMKNAKEAFTGTLCGSLFHIDSYVLVELTG